MITVDKVFNDPNEMHNFIKDYLKEYAPAGYDTKVIIEIEQTYQEWLNNKLYYVVTITRQESCD